MPNSLTTNPWTLDTAGATVLYNTDVKVRHFEFVGYASATDRCIIQDRYGKVIWQADGTVDFEEVRSAHVGWVHGIVAATIEGGGTVRVYIE